jgi:major membrane immunogen (membrane-anchored lipoprotein)
MNTTFHLNSNELDEKFLKAVKTMFKGKKISIVIEDYQDETEYLTTSDANRQILEKRIKDVEASKQTVKVNLDDL